MPELDPAEQLLDKIVNTPGGKWPPPDFKAATEKVRTWRAFLDNDRTTLKAAVNWPTARDYKVDGLPGLIADAWADHVFDEDLKVTSETNKKPLAQLIEGMGDLDGELREAERANVAEGERWWRWVKDEAISEYPVLEWHGRDEVLPLFAGRRLLAAAIVTHLRRPKDADRGSVWRHLEVHTGGAIEHVLFVGTKGRIGHTEPIEAHPDLVELADALGASGGEGQVWNHGIGWLMGRVTNARGIDKDLNLGRSEYERIYDQLLDLNEAATIGAENARLTAKRRVVMPESAITNYSGPELVDQGDGTFRQVQRATADLGADVIVQSEIDRELGSSPDATFKVLEYSFDAQALIAYKRDLVETAVTRVNLTPQYLGVVGGEGGLALTGTALRIRLIPTTKGGKGKGGVWDDALPVILTAGQRLDALPEADGGFGRPWPDAEQPPTVERPSGLPSDEVEDASVEATLVGAGVKSTWQSIKSQHPDWDDPAVEEEIKRIQDDRATSAAAGMIPGLA